MFKTILTASLMLAISSALAAECILTLSLDGRPLLQNRIEVASNYSLLTVIDEDKNEIITFTKNRKGLYDMTFGYPFSNVLVSGAASITKTSKTQFVVKGSVKDDQNNSANIDGVIVGCE